MKPAHGTRARYIKGCRCYRCRSANTEYHRRYRESPPPRRSYAKHGDLSMYNRWGCRCNLCRATKSEVMKQAYYGG